MIPPLLTAARPNALARSAYALPLVLMAVVVIGLFSGIALTRFAAQTRTVNQQLDGYSQTHAALGLQEAIALWPGLRADDFEDYLLAEAGRAYRDPRLALTIELDDGSRVLVWFTDGQGTILSDARGLTEDAYATVARVYQRLFDNSRLAGASQFEFEALTRPVGPAQVSIRAASDPVLRAICEGLLPSSLAQRQYVALAELAARDQAVSATDLENAYSTAGVDDEQRASLRRVLTSAPTLYRVLVDVQGSTIGSGVIARYVGLVEVGRTARSGAELEQGGRFLNWEELPVTGQTEPGRFDPPPAWARPTARSAATLGAGG